MQARCARTTISRRNMMIGSAALGAVATTSAVALPAPSDTAGFSFQSVIDRAQALARDPWKPNNWKPSRALETLSYDQYRALRFRPEAALWRDAGLFRVELFHVGSTFSKRVTINTIENGVASRVIYSPQMFDFGENAPEPPPQSSEFSGFRLHHPMMRPDYFDEFAVFLGASYFRLIGREQTYGASCRGLAIDTALPSGEEFPSFTEFWIERPAVEANSVIVYTLMDSASLAGAFRFELRPRGSTEADVQAVLFVRRDIAKLGIAPLTSMFMYGEGNYRFSDLRPEVHDSDGLSLHGASGEWLWRPLVNGKALRTSSFVGPSPKGFGLMQRDRRPGHYLDGEAIYHRRPSLWITPREGFGDGRVELIEIPTDKEIHDNIVSAWVPAKPTRAGDRVQFSYLISAQGEAPPPAAFARILSTRTGPATAANGARRFLIEFEGGELATLRASQSVKAVLSATTGGIASSLVNCADGVWTASFDFTPDSQKAADLRCYLSLFDVALSETWSFQWTA